MAWYSVFDSQVVEMTHCPSTAGGCGTTLFTAEVSVGLNVTTLPFSRPMAICFPLGDHDTASRKSIYDNIRVQIELT